MTGEDHEAAVPIAVVSSVPSLGMDDLRPTQDGGEACMTTPTLREYTYAVVIAFLVYVLMALAVVTYG